MAKYVQKTVRLAAAGSPQQISTGTEDVLSITFTAAPTNTGTLYVGDKDADKDGTPPQGKTLLPGQVKTVKPSDFYQNDGLPHTTPLSSFWFDGTVSEDDLEYFALVNP